MNKTIENLQYDLGYVFKNASLCIQALTHRSYGAQHNERLEFLGDAILDLLIGEWLYNQYPAASEGELSHMRAQVVCGEYLAGIGQRLALGQYLYLGAGEAQSGGRERQSSIANAVEALIAAVYLDGGMDCCRAVTNRLFGQILLQVKPGTGKDAKTRLQEYLQARQLALPRYSLQARSGSDHDASFTMICEVLPLNISAAATASSRKKAEQQAAEKILLQLESDK